jgi:hypothetical protein
MIVQENRIWKKAAILIADRAKITQEDEEGH